MIQSGEMNVPIESRENSSEGELRETFAISRLHSENRSDLKFESKLAQACPYLGKFLLHADNL